MGKDMAAGRFPRFEDFWQSQSIINSISIFSYNLLLTDKLLLLQK